MEKLIQAALAARQQAYVPYSNFPVGAAVLTANQKIYSGCNVENVSYGLCNCAERTAIFKAVSEGEQQLESIAIVADTDQPVAPCGACRQVMAEFGIQTVILCNVAGQQYRTTVEELLPYSFTKKYLSGEKV